MTIRVALVDDQLMIRSGFAMIMGTQPDLEVVGEASNGRAALDLLKRVTADVVVMDIRMPVMDGVTATRTLCARPHSPKVLVLTTFDTDADAFAALQAGASGFLIKTVPPEQLLSAIRAVAVGDSVVAPRVTRVLLDRYAQSLYPDAAVDEKLAGLTDREREVLRLVGLGRTNQEIAAELSIAEATVKTHFGRTLAKLNLRDRVHAIMLAYEIGLVSPGQH